MQKSGCTKLLKKQASTSTALCSYPSGRTLSTCLFIHCNTQCLCVYYQSLYVFEDPYGTPFSRPLPTPVCLVSFGADLTPHPSTHIPNTAVARFGGTRTASSIESVAEHVQHCTGGECGIIQSPIAGAARDAAAKQRQTAVICPSRVTNDEVQQHLMRAACAVVFVSPPLFVTQRQSKRRCVEGSLIAFFTNAGASSFFVRHTLCISTARCLTLLSVAENFF